MKALRKLLTKPIEGHLPDLPLIEKQGCEGFDMHTFAAVLGHRFDRDDDDRSCFVC